MLEASASSDVSGRKRSKSSSVYTDTVTVQIGPGVQLCPAIFVPSQKRIPQAVKYIYSRLAASSCEIDQGVPDLVLSLVSSGNAFSQSFRKRLEKSLNRLIGQCAVWIVSSGEKSDPLALIASNAQQTILNEKDCEEETLSIIINSSSTVCCNPGQPSTSVVDSRFNTLFMLLNEEGYDRVGMARFKAYSTVKLANPPPALLIGVREERSHPTSGGPTPSGLSMSQQAIILPSSPSSDKHPVPVALFAGADLSSLIEFLELVKCSIPVLVIQESSKLCTILRSSWLHYHKGGAAFDHLVHRRWLLAELGHMGEAQKAADAICEILAVASGDNPLIGFISVDQVESNRLVDSLLELAMNSAGDVDRLRQVVRVAAKLNVTSVVAKTDLDGLLDHSSVNAVWSDAMRDDNRLQILSVLLDQQVQLSITPDMLMNLLAETHDQFFFNTIILGQCLRYSHSLNNVSERFIADVNKLMEKLSEGMTAGSCTFFPMTPYAAQDRNQSIQILCIWALMLHRTELAKCLAAYLNEPIPMALVLARVAKSLAHMSHDWVFYEESLNQLSEHFSNFAVRMLDKTHKESTDRSYQLLCRSIPGFGNVTMSQLAFLSNNKAFISHECCQRWLLRLLYGNIHVRSTPGSSLSIIPKWAKILLSALLVFPTRIWIFSRSNTTLPGVPPRRPISPTVALLESGRQAKRLRAVSMVSLHSGKSDTREETKLLTVGAGTREEDSPPSVVIAGGNGNGSQHGVHHEHMDSGKKRKRKKSKSTQISRCSAPPPLKEFYSTPIVKYWISLVFRLTYLFFFAYSITIPGCGNLYIDLGVWIWTFIWWSESMWVFAQRKKRMPFEHGSWYIFDNVMVFLQLILFFVFRLGEHNIPDGIPIAEFAYGSRIVSSFFLLYQCYATLFYYIPLSDTLGPFLVRVKLMLLRDFLNFFVFVALVIVSNAIAVSAIVYPDREGPLKLLPKAISWAWLMLFTTDLSPIRESDHCRNSLLAANRADTCSRVGGIADAECPTQSWAGYTVVIEYLIVLKLICYPILFALFAKTAKSVDDEAKSIYRYQLYSLVADFSQRPFLPPPLTPIFFIGAGCCRALFKCMRMGTDHPDVKPSIPMIGLLPGSTLDLMDRKSSTVYRNPTMPALDDDPNAEYCKRMAVDMWRTEAVSSSGDADCAVTRQVRQLSEQLDLLRMSASFTSDRLAHETDPVYISYADSSHAKKIVVCHTDRPWSILSPRYNPPIYNKPAEDFPEEQRRFVDPVDGEGHLEMLRQCRQKQISELVAGEKSEVLRLGNGGLPLNPNGRTDHAKRLDEHFATVLRAVNINESEAQVLSTHAHLPVAQRENNIAHVSTRAHEERIDTDNAWTEVDVWAIRLGGATVVAPSREYSWVPKAALTLEAPFREFVTDSFTMLPC
ncbi:hypothetical protein QR680_015168 [Steinernema hermaphroditum]|uniref:TRPM-like domain-containing protein n=1 Tax=Steinernema hermaphroditum TaxID=289476 RepID=A0AA39ICZ7_9BILA|nr:hypothetical protein QR680_015168 [Steinernema hermaphroditum]